MKPLLRKIVRVSIAAGLCLLASVSANAQEDSVGIVRITKLKTSAMAPHQVTPTAFQNADQCQPATANCDCQNGVGGNQGPCPADWNGNSAGVQCRRCRGSHGGLWGNHSGCPCNDCNGDSGQAMCDYFRCKFGYFIPTGAGGAGVPFCGHYSRVYPQDPYYFDQRDGQAWAAQGYGTPIAVPLAPVVGHTYNYGWGIPSSRLTPVSRPAY